MLNSQKKSLALIIIPIIILLVSSISLMSCSRVRVVSMKGDKSEVYTSVSQLKEAATTIVEASVIDQETIVHSEIPFTISRIKILSTIKGGLKEGEEIKVIETGGLYKQPDGDSKVKAGAEVEVTFEGVRVMKPGEKVILFMREFVGPQLKNGYVPIGVHQGKFKVNKDGIVQKQAPKEYPFEDYKNPLYEEDLKANLK